MELPLPAGHCVAVPACSHCLGAGCSGPLHWQAPHFCHLFPQVHVSWGPTPCPPPSFSLPSSSPLVFQLTRKLKQQQPVPSGSHLSSTCSPASVCLCLVLHCFPLLFLLPLLNLNNMLGNCHLFDQVEGCRGTTLTNCPPPPSLSPFSPSFPLAFDD